MYYHGGYLFNKSICYIPVTLDCKVTIIYTCIMKTKVCTKCKSRKSIKMFHNVTRNADGLADWCRRCFNNANIVWREKNWDRKMEQQKDRRHELRERLQVYRSGLKCEVCGEGEQCCLDFHHTDSKTKELEIGSVVGRGWSWERILKEINKCK